MTEDRTALWFWQDQPAWLTREIVFFDDFADSPLIDINASQSGWSSNVPLSKKFRRYLQGKRA